MTPKSKEELRDKLADIQWLTGLNDKAWYEKFGNTKGLYGLFTSYAQNLYSRQDVKAICEKVIEAGRVDGMFIEWNGLNLSDIAKQRQSIDSIIDKWGK